MEEARDRIVSLSTASGAAEERMLGADLVSEMVARKDRGAGIKQIARELGVDRKTVRRWLKLGAWQPRQVQRRARQLDRFAQFIERRAPEVGFNGAVLYRELQGLGFTGGIVQVQRWLRPQRERRKWSELATVRFETGPGEQGRSITASLRSGSASSWRRFICSCSRWGIRAGFTRTAITTNG